METLVKLNASLLQSTPITPLLTRCDKPLQHQIFIMHWNTLKLLDESLGGPCARTSNTVNSTEFLPVVSGCYRDKVPTYLSHSHKSLPSILHCCQLIRVCIHIVVELLHVVSVLLHLSPAHGDLLEALLVCLGCCQPLLEGFLLSRVRGQLAAGILAPLQALLDLYTPSKHRESLTNELRHTMYLVYVRTYTSPHASADRIVCTTSVIL